MNGQVALDRSARPLPEICLCIAHSIRVVVGPEQQTGEQQEHSHTDYRFYCSPESEASCADDWRGRNSQRP